MFDGLITEASTGIGTSDASKSNFSLASGGSAKTADRIYVLEEKTKNLEDKARDIRKSLILSEKSQNKAMNFMMTVATVIIIGFFFAAIPFFFDYYRDSARQYEKYTKRIDELSLRVKILEGQR